MLSNSRLSKTFWAEAIYMACFLVNRSPSFAINKKSLEKLWSGTPANYSDLKIFGCPTFVHVDNGKLKPRSKRYLFLGYKPGVKGYILWDPKVSKVVISKDVIFYEIAMLRGLSTKETNPRHHQSSDIQVEFEIDKSLTSESSSSSQIMSSSKSSLEASVGPSYYCIAKDKPRRIIKPPQRYAETSLVPYALNVVEDIDYSEEPSNYSEAVSCPESGRWITAMH